MSAIQESIQEVYIGLLGRAADQEGLTYWEGQINSGFTIEDLRENIINSQTEYAEGLGLLSRGELVEALYDNMFGRTPDLEGYAYWVSGEGAAVSDEDMVTTLVRAAQGSDVTVLDNKATAANYFTTNAPDSTDTAAAAAAVADVDATEASVTAAQATVDALTEQAPVFAGSATATTNEDTAVVLDASFTDVNDNLATVVASAENGTVDVDTKMYTPNANFNGTDTITTTATDEAGNTVTQEITVTVNAVNDAPSITAAATATVDEDSSVVIAAPTATDIDDDTVTLSATATNGTVVLAEDGTATYTPTADYNGSATVTFTATDAGGASSSASTTVTVNPVAETQVLTTATTDILNGTAEADIFDGSTQNTLQTGDIIQDLTSGDGDILNVTSTQTTAAPRLSNIETVNLDGPFIAVGMALTNVTGTTTLNLNSGLPTGTATVTDANSLNVATIAAGSNIQTLNVTSLASGTRDTVQINAGSAETVTVTGNATAADTYSVDLAADATLSLATMNNTSVDTVTVDAAGDFTLTSNITIATDDLTVNINAEADTTVTMTNAAADSASAIVLSGDDIILDFADGDDISGAANNSGVEITSTANSATVQIDAITDGTFLNQAVVDTVQFTADLGAGGFTVTVNEDSNVLFTADATGTSALTLNVDNADGDGNNGTLRTTVSESLSTSALTTGAAVDTVIINVATDEAADTDADANGTAETNLTIDDLTLNATTTTAVITGADDLTITALNYAAASTIAATAMTGDLTITDTVDGGAGLAATYALGSGNDTISDTEDDGVATVFGNDGDDDITTGGADDIINGGNGDDTLSGAAGADTIRGDAGADTINGGAGADTITGGAGADEIRMASSQDGDTISDFTASEDTLVLTGAGDDIDLTDLSGGRTASAYDLDGTGNFDITLTGVTADDLSGAIQLGRAVDATYLVTETANSSSTIVAGDSDDFIAIRTTFGGTTEANTVSLTLGGGTDTLTLEEVDDATDATTVTVTDFVLGTDQIILEGTSGGTIDVTSVTPAAGVYDFDGAGTFAVTLNNGGSALSDTDLSSSVTLGSENANFVLGGAHNLTLGAGDDFIDFDTGGNASVVNIESNGGYDTFDNFELDEDDFSFDGMSGITATAGTAVAANADQVADAVSGSVYVFADSSDGTGSEAITTFTTNTANGITAATILADVASFLNAGLNSAADERYIAIINDNGTAGDAYIYDVTASSDGITSAGVTLIGKITEEDGDVITAAAIA